VDTSHIDAASQYADVMARLLASPDCCRKRAARCALPTATHMADRLLETLTSVTVERP